MSLKEKYREWQKLRDDFYSLSWEFLGYYKTFQGSAVLGIILSGFTFACVIFGILNFDVLFTCVMASVFVIPVILTMFAVNKADDCLMEAEICVREAKEINRIMDSIWTLHLVDIKGEEYGQEK